MSDTVIGNEGFNLLDKTHDDALTEVWKAYNLSLRCTVNICFLKAEAVSDESKVHDFIGAARKTAGIVHPNIQFLYDVAQTDGVPCVVTEHIEGPTLETITKTGPMLPTKAIPIIISVAKALQYAWESRQLTHRNIQPACIKIEDITGNVKLTNLGQDPRFYFGSTGGVTQGNPYFLSPEQAKGASGFDYRTDMYGLGATLYCMLTGVVPFSHCKPREALQMQVLGKLKNPQNIVSHISPMLLHVLEKLMMKNVEDRYRNWKQAISAIEKAINTKVVVKHRSSKTESTIDTTKPVSKKKALKRSVDRYRKRLQR